VPKCLVENATGKPLEVAIEPWAQLEVLQPGGRATVECDGDDEIEFSVESDGSVCVGVKGAWVRIVANGAEKSYGSP